MYDFPLLQGGVGGICAVRPNQAGEGVRPSVSHHAPAAAEGHKRVIGSANRALSRHKNVNYNNTLRSLYYYIIIIMIASRKLMCKKFKMCFFLWVVWLLLALLRIPTFLTNLQISINNICFAGYSRVIEINY